MKEDAVVDDNVLHQIFHPVINSEVLKWLQYCFISIWKISQHMEILNTSLKSQEALGLSSFTPTMASESSKVTLGKCLNSINIIFNTCSYDLRHLNTQKRQHNIVYNMRKAPAVDYMMSQHKLKIDVSIITRGTL
jgi:hypothetical protein